MAYSDIAAALLTRLRSDYGCEPEFLWARTPGFCVFRHTGNGKWFAVLMPDLPGAAVGLPERERVDILNVKCDPLLKGSLLDGRRILPGYHMNKEHWLSLVLDGALPPEEIFSLVDLSHRLTAPRRRAPKQEKL